LVYHEPIFRKFIRKMCKQLLDDGVFYVDMRSAFDTPYRSLKSEEWDPDYFNLLHTDDEIEKFKASEEGKTSGGARMIWTTSDNSTTATSLEVNIISFSLLTSPFSLHAFRYHRSRYLVKGLDWSGVDWGVRSTPVQIAFGLVTSYYGLTVT
jgi:hypothetical protein